MPWQKSSRLLINRLTSPMSGVALPVHPQPQTLPDSFTTSEKCQKRKCHLINMNGAIFNPKRGAQLTDNSRTAWDSLHQA